jgi:5-azacytidine-induced protein 1
MEMKELHERNKIEKQMWEENYLKKQDAILMTKEREMRERLRQERDMEIETVIHKLESETAAVKEESDRAAESRIKRIRDKYETELKEVEKSEKNTLQKFNSMKVQVTELESQVIKLRSQLRLKEEEVNEVNEIATRLTRERDQFADVVRQEFSDQLVRLEQENREVKMEMTEIISKHKFELERLQRNKERELSEVHERVKHALTKKEENHKALKAQHEVNNNNNK